MSPVTNSVVPLTRLSDVPSSRSRSALNPAAQLPSRAFAGMGDVHGEQTTLNGASDAASVRSSQSRWRAPSSVLAGVSGSSGSLL